MSAIAETDDQDNSSPTPTNPHIAALDDRLRELFPADSAHLSILCKGLGGAPYGGNHPDFFAHACGLSLAPEHLERIRLGYVMLAAYYFLFDAAADNHLQHPTDSLYLPHLLTGALTEFTLVCLAVDPAKLVPLHTLVRRYLAANASAIKNEQLISSRPLLEDQPEEFYSIVGRSNAVLLLYDLLSLITDRAPDDRVTDIVTWLAYYIQMADDLGDWRDDYKNGRYTSFLRRCFARHDAVIDEPGLEEEVLLGGAFEERSAIVINGLAALLDKIDALPYRMEALQAYVTRQKDRIYAVLKDRVTAKTQA